MLFFSRLTRPTIPNPDQIRAQQDRRRVQQDGHRSRAGRQSGVAQPHGGDQAGRRQRDAGDGGGQGVKRVGCDLIYFLICCPSFYRCNYLCLRGALCRASKSQWKKLTLVFCFSPSRRNLPLYPPPHQRNALVRDSLRHDAGDAGRGAWLNAIFWRQLAAARACARRSLARPCHAHLPPQRPVQRALGVG